MSSLSYPEMDILSASVFLSVLGMFMESIVLKDNVFRTRNAKPPPLFLSLSCLTSTYPGVTGSLDFDVNLVSCSMAIWMLFLFTKNQL